MVEVESILNSRPLVPICMDSTGEAPLTPNHLLLLRNSLNVSPGIFSQDDNYARKRWRHIQYLTDQFWVRWIRKYLPTLQERSKWLGKQRNFNEGDVILLVDKTAPRGQWLVGRILQTFPDDKGCVRTVSVRTKNGVVKRPIAKLCLVSSAPDNWQERPFWCAALLYNGLFIFTETATAAAPMDCFSAEATTRRLLQRTMDWHFCWWRALSLQTNARRISLALSQWRTTRWEYFELFNVVCACRCSLYW